MHHIGEKLSKREGELEQQRQAAGERRKRFQAEEARYTLVLHKARKDLGITVNEYCVADSVHKLSRNPRSPVPGWCFATKEHLGKSLGFSRQSIHSMINSLTKKGIVEISAETGYLRTTEIWYERVETLRETLNK
jgi:biotin operon repressor